MTNATYRVEELARFLVEKHGGTIKARKEQVTEVFDALRTLMSIPNLEAKDRVFIKDFGIFTLKLRSGRTVVNGLGAGKAYDVPPKYTWSFKPVSAFANDLNAE